MTIRSTVLAALIIGLAIPAKAQITLESHSSATNFGSSTATTAATDCHLATLLVTCGAGDQSVANAISDSVNGSSHWVSLTAYKTVTSTQAQIWYCPVTAGQCTVTSSMTFSNNAFNPSVTAACFQGTATASPFDSGTDVGTGSDSTSTTFQPGSMTPNNANEVVINCISTGTNAGASLTISTGTITDTVALNGTIGSANGYPMGMAELIQGAASASNPTWTSANVTSAALGQAAFKKAAAAGGGPGISNSGPFVLPEVAHWARSVDPAVIGWSCAALLASLISLYVALCTTDAILAICRSITEIRIARSYKGDPQVSAMMLKEQIEAKQRERVRVLRKQV